MPRRMNIGGVSKGRLISLLVSPDIPDIFLNTSFGRICNQTVLSISICNAIIVFLFGRSAQNLKNLFLKSFKNFGLICYIPDIFLNIRR